MNNNEFRHKLYEIIFEADTKMGKWFDIILMYAILLSVAAVLLETVPSLDRKYHKIFIAVEWFFTILFTIEYVLRIYTVHFPRKYAMSFYGIIDLLSIIPTYLSIFVAGTQSLVVIRALRLLRVFRILKLGSVLHQSQHLTKSLLRSVPKIGFFLSFILVLVTIIGTFMHIVEGGNNEAFDSIPRSIYWAIVTLTTVGYGDITPQTSLGQFLSALVMLLGYAIIAVPTGIVSAEMIRTDDEISDDKITTQVCRECLSEGHDIDAEFCKFCGHELHEDHHED